MTTVYINKFDKGVVNDPRDPREAVCRRCVNFDALTNPYKLTPYFDSVSGDASASTSQKQAFAIALRSGTTYNLYALGRQSAVNRAEVLMKSLTTGSATDLDDDSWATPNNNQSSTATPNFNFFVYYKKRGRIFGAEGGTRIFSFDPSSAATWDDEGHNLAYTTMAAQGLVHSKDDILYIPYDNKIAKNDNNSWTDAALTLPTHLYITSIAEKGNDIAVGCSPLDSFGRSSVYIWNRDASLATLSESVDWGRGQLKWIRELNGVLVGASLISSGSSASKDRIVFKYYTGYGVKEFLVIEGTGASSQLLSLTQEDNGRILFMMSITKDGVLHEGVWSIGQRDDGTFSLVHERTPNDDTATTGGVLKAFYKVGDFLFQSFIDNTAYTLTKTNDQASYTASAICETTVNPNMPREDRPKRKQILFVGANYESLPAAGQIIVKYRKDGASSWTTIFTETTNSKVFTSMKSLKTGELREIEFRIESTGGAVVTGLRYEYDVMPE